MAGLESIRSEELRVEKGERTPNSELAALRIPSEALFFKLIIQAEKPELAVVALDTIHSSEHTDVMLKIFNEGVQTFFSEWWLQQETQGAVTPNESPEVIARRVYDAYTSQRTLH